MKEYYEYKQKMEAIQNEYRTHLEKILEKNDIHRTNAWLKFGDNGLIIIWETKIIETRLLNQLQDQFGKIRTISCNNTGNGLLIEFYMEL